MSFVDNLNNWDKKRVLIIGEALVDKYIVGNADKISPDAPVPNIKIEQYNSYIGAIGLVIQFILSLGGNPEVCTILGNDYEGEFFLNKIKQLKIDHSGIIIDENINTPQITRIKAMNQHVLRLEVDYSSEIATATSDALFKTIEAKSAEIDSIIILDHGIGGLFKDAFIQRLLEKLKQWNQHIPIIARPNLHNYYLYENIDLIRINLQDALDLFSIKK